MLSKLLSRIGWLAVGAALTAGSAAMLGSLSCATGNESPRPVIPPEVSGNVPPTLTITEPVEDASVSQGDSFTISWTDTDRDSAALISFDLVGELDPTLVIPLVEGLPENDLDANLNPTSESYLAPTNVAPPGRFHIRGTIQDGVNAPVRVFATLEDSATARVILTVTERGFVPSTTPPVVVVTAPTFNLSIAQNDELLISVQPTVNDPAPEFPYDPDSDGTLYIVLDVDEDPTNDDPANPDPDEIIVLAMQSIQEGEFEAIEFTEVVDLADIPLRPAGNPYFVRATIISGADRVHDYANGTLSVGQAASGQVDLGLVGRGLLGARFQGFNPGSWLGWRMTTARDFDADGIDDFILLARFGNPRNFGNIGEGYLIYGHDQLRFGSTINVNSTSSEIPGVIFEAPPPRFEGFSSTAVPNPRTEGLTDVAVIGDLSGDGRPDLLFGMPHVDGVYQARDDDPGDNPPEPDATVEVDITLRQGFNEITVGDQDPFERPPYYGFEDTYIDSANPGDNFGSREFLRWINEGPDDKTWTLIRINDLLNEIPDDRINVTSLNATLSFRVVDEGDDGTVHECFTPFNETNVTFDNFAEGGGEPQAGLPGDEDVDYDQDELGSVGGPPAQRTEVDISEMLQKLIDRELGDVGNDVLLIIVPGEEGENEVTVRSSDADEEREFPELNITYQRQTFGGARGCYPDELPNNLAEEENDDDFAGTVLTVNEGLEALGLVSLVYSDNRDNQGPLNPDRLETTVMSLEFAGQQGDPLLEFEDYDNIFPRADADEEGRIAGCRFQAGLFDVVDHLELNQPPLEGLFGMNVDSMPDVNADGLDEIIISAPGNEQDVVDLEEGGFFPFSTHLAARSYRGSIIVFPGADYDDDFWRDKTGEEGCASIPILDNTDDIGSCSLQDPQWRVLRTPTDTFEIFAEDPKDFLGGGRYAGDFNLDGVSDILCGAPFNDSAAGDDTGAAYVVYGRLPIGDVDLSLADNAATRPPMLRIRGREPGDMIGTRQELLGDIDGDRITDVVISSPTADFGGIGRTGCAGDFDGDGDVQDDLDTTLFNACLEREVFFDNDCGLSECKVFDYDNDRRITEADRTVLDCLRLEDGSDCCPVDNGFVGIIFGGVTIDGDRDISQVGTSDLPGVRFFGTSAGDRAGVDVGSAGDFNQDGFDDLLIAVPGKQWIDDAGQCRLGVAYLIFGGAHLRQEAQINEYDLALVGTDELPGIVFYSPYVAGFPDEAPLDHVGFLGDINNDGFADIAIGNTRADFIDLTLPQDPDDPGTDPSVGRRPDAGDVYVIYGNNFGSNRR